MRINHPVTQREYEFPDNATLMSTTDAKSRITYANAAFVQVSGFALDELYNQPHNLVRHPDMPPEAFADLWRTLKNGEPWSALIKNRCKNGDHYWVRANAIPIIRNGVTQGYMSVRTKPGAEEVQGAQKLYQAMLKGEAAGKQFFKGLVIRSGWKRIFSIGRVISVRSRIRLNMLLVWALTMVSLFALQGIHAEDIPAYALITAAFVIGNYLLESQLARPIEQLRKQALDVATGNNRDVVQMDRVDEIGMTMRTISQLGLMFRWLIDDVSQQVTSVRTAVDEISRGNQDLRERTHHSTSSLAQTASVMEQMNATVQNNNATSQEANALAKKSSQAVNQGGQAMQKVVDVMAEIASSSYRMNDIIGVIDGIAFQTNILALNAAVEAARAGEQGRGFAVVASEVRALAQRSANAAKEIKELIDSSVGRVESGATLVHKTRSEIEEVVAHVEQVTALIAQISGATHEQRDGIAEANHSIGHLDSITQQNAALVQQNAAAAESLQTQTRQLDEAVSVFR
ncbi:methyl-accepting chemotaxis protein [Comamonas terrae]|uniref:PAS domain-containing methyl-accepting chemotaxis protein n=1 Tax=Comamonas terrae TaxID=673548 RepID=A0ABW5UQL8_9BURK|nr:PAS domain-containing methyl-accepting chemotaxis protein [Comamonas terrae]